jgi:hypothetical protein
VDHTAYYYNLKGQAVRLRPSRELTISQAQLVGSGGSATEYVQRRSDGEVEHDELAPPSASMSAMASIIALLQRQRGASL